MRMNKPQNLETAKEEGTATAETARNIGETSVFMKAKEWRLKRNTSEMSYSTALQRKSEKHVYKISETDNECPLEPLDGAGTPSESSRRILMQTERRRP